MGWKLVDRPKTTVVDRKLALKFANMDSAPHDRPLSERRMAVYERLMREGKFRPVTWATADCKETGATYRVNGKHTSKMLSTMDVLPEFFVTVEHYTCDTLEDVAQLYATFDSKMQSRTASDIYLSFAATCKELKDLPVRVIINCTSGLAYAQYGGDTYYRTQPADRAELLLEHSEFVVWFHQLMTASGEYSDSHPSASKNKYQHITRQGVVAAMFLCWQKDVDAATKFWLEVRDETGKTPDLPSRRLAKLLVTSNMKTSKSYASNFTKTGKLDLRQVFVKCLHAWNAWRKGAATKMQYHPEAPVPDVQ